jgi:Matrixin
MSVTIRIDARRAIVRGVLATLAMLNLSRFLNPIGTVTPNESRKLAVRMDRVACIPNHVPSVGWDGPGRGTASLQYYIGSVPNYLDRDAVKLAIESAMQQWAAVADIRFTQTAQPHQPRSIDFTFKEIDGPGGTLARAFLPGDVSSEPTAGDVEFDSAEIWEIGDSCGDAAFDLIYVAVHEAGHALGLYHSSEPGSVMAPTVSPQQSFRQLDPSGIDAVLKLYAAARGARFSVRLPNKLIPAPHRDPGARSAGHWRAGTGC